MAKDEFIKVGSTDIGDCHACGYRTRGKWYKAPPHRLPRRESSTWSDDKWLRDYASLFCELCASTLSGNSHSYPGSHPNGDILQTVCYVGNVLLAELRNAAAGETGVEQGSWMCGVGDALVVIEEKRQHFASAGNRSASAAYDEVVDLIRALLHRGSR